MWHTLTACQMSTWLFSSTHRMERYQACHMQLWMQQVALCLHRWSIINFDNAMQVSSAAASQHTRLLCAEQTCGERGLVVAPTCVCSLLKGICYRLKVCARQTCVKMAAVQRQSHCGPSSAAAALVCHVWCIWQSRKTQGMSVLLVDP